MLSCWSLAGFCQWRLQAAAGDRLWPCHEPLSPRLATAQYLPGSTAGKRWSYSASRPEHITHSDQSQHTRVDTHSDFASFLPMSYVSIHSNWYHRIVARVLLLA